MCHFARAVACLFVLLFVGAGTPRAQGLPEGSDILKPFLPIGIGALTTNDWVIDGSDRWRTGGLSVSTLWGPAWTGELPTRPFALAEFRLRADAISPEEVTAPMPAGTTDRRYAGVLSAGAHTHFRMQAWEIAAGADMIWTGQQTNIGAIHSFLHDTFGGAELVTRASEIPDGFHPTAVLEVGRTLAFSDRRVRLRPFVEAQAGLETFTRLGADLTLATKGMEPMLVRDNGTGHRYAAVPGDPGVSLTMGFDVAKVTESDLLPASLGYTLTPLRSRARVGLLFQENLPLIRNGSLFLGLTWHSKEFETQRESQMTTTMAFGYSF
ncbi:lipid A-modifier LpxR family protein [Algicella marina]|uniref:DUF2219 family protein n=1 Tax=Algicella marina TaxID=2683284 RepID=A0A6P1T583_9RHOB|nr:lipid A-modifier LpxR family protein [Algicella marina]QHQ37197.1 DUF2219 family protein [Algicella marina]